MTQTDPDFKLDCVKAQILKHRITIGSWEELQRREQLDFMKKFQVIVNVADSPLCTIEMLDRNFVKLTRPSACLWFPIEEKERWPFATLLGICRILDWATKSHHEIFVHCSAGSHRSKVAVAIYLITHLGYSAVEAARAVNIAEDRLLRTLEKLLEPEAIGLLQHATRVPSTYGAQGVRDSYRSETPS